MRDLRLGAAVSIMFACGCGAAALPTLECPLTTDGRSGLERTLERFPYEVEGKTPTELKASMEKRAPFPRKKDSEVAAIGQRVCTAYDFTTDNGRCRAVRIRVVVKMSYIFPRWSNRSGASPEALKWWAEEERRTFVHEDGHVAIVDDAMKGMHEQLLAIAEAPTCEELQTKLDARRDELWEMMLARQMQYDRDTKNGLTQ